MVQWRERGQQNRLQASDHHLRGLSGTSSAAVKKEIENPVGKLPLMTHPRPSLPSLGQGEESKWLRIQGEREFYPIVREPGWP